ncbi:c6 transcription factor [Acrodontium crateriforme]|uniref:C6 transcription factor n=1 Tax=Acrodontium crateriforme TaxID=150365 RepID=A0AAQ3MBT4_9PEZI|nr:c6 transcription factor [Acrodontium crateriforme]
MSLPAQPSIQKPQRLLACVRCQQRKVKCDRQFPCHICLKAQVQCVPAAPAPRQTRRRFPERILLDRLRHYEGLLRDLNVDFEPLLSNGSGLKKKTFSSTESNGSPSSPGDGALPTTPQGSNAVVETLSLWESLHRISIEDKEEDTSDDGAVDTDDDLNENGFHSRKAVKKTWDRYYNAQDSDVLFGSPQVDIDLSPLHPLQGHIFKLWQTYLVNVDPLLKVTHTPTLQPRIIDAATDIVNVTPALEALMFSIYTMALLSLDDEECLALLGSQKQDLLDRYAFGCQQALFKCGYLRSNDRDCLVALHLLLVSRKSKTDPRSLSSILGVASRIAQRLGLSGETTNSKSSALEAELRRRLWWSHVIFDNRICEIDDYKSTSLTPMWNCKIPVNLNDADLRAEIKEANLQGHMEPTEAIFVVVRCELHEFLRRSNFHLDFTNPYLKTSEKVSEPAAIHELERMLEQKYLKNCNPDVPLHYMTIWATRGFLAKLRMLDYFSTSARTQVSPSETEHDLAVGYALSMVECDTKLYSSPLTKGYRWLIESSFPFAGYVHLIQELRQRPLVEYAKTTWKVLNDNFIAHNVLEEKDPTHPFFTLVGRGILPAWNERQAALARIAEPPEEKPRLVASCQRRFEGEKPTIQNEVTTNEHAASTDFSFDDLALWTLPIDDESEGITFGQVNSQVLTGNWPTSFSEMDDRTVPNLFLHDHTDWNMMG